MSEEGTAVTVKNYLSLRPPCLFLFWRANQIVCSKFQRTNQNAVLRQIFTENKRLAGLLFLYYELGENLNSDWTVVPKWTNDAIVFSAKFHMSIIIFNSTPAAAQDFTLKLKKISRNVRKKSPYKDALISGSLVTKSINQSINDKPIATYPHIADLKNLQRSLSFLKYHILITLLQL